VRWLLAGEHERSRGREEVNLDALRNILALLWYKNCSFVAGDLADGTLWIQVQYPVVNKGIGRTARARRWFIEPESTPWQVVATAFKAVLTVEEHEARESFLYKGVGVFYPHHDLEELVSLRHKERIVRGTSEAEDEV
jgi:hypothetical protein